MLVYRSIFYRRFLVERRCYTYLAWVFSGGDSWSRGRFGFSTMSFSIFSKLKMKLKGTETLKNTSHTNTNATHMPMANRTERLKNA